MFPPFYCSAHLENKQIVAKQCKLDDVSAILLLSSTQKIKLPQNSASLTMFPPFHCSARHKNYQIAAIQCELDHISGISLLSSALNRICWNARGILSRSWCEVAARSAKYAGRPLKACCAAQPRGCSARFVPSGCGLNCACWSGMFVLRVP